MIELTEWNNEIDLLERGQTVRVNHDKCPAGQDTRRRLYLTRPHASPDVVLGYCHNCQDKGIRTTGDRPEYRQYDRAIENVALTSGEDLKTPENMVYTVNDWPVEAVAWRIKKSLTQTMCEKAGIAYDPATHRIFLPIWDKLKGGKPYDTSILPSQQVGYQLRRLSDTGPKYLTAVKDTDVDPSTKLVRIVTPRIKKSVVAILVEDLASGLVVERACRVSGTFPIVLVNYGTKITVEVLIRATDFNTAIVWLDNDSSHVLNQAHKIAKVWRMVSGGNVVVHEGTIEPKAMKLPELEEVIRNYNGQH